MKMGNDTEIIKVEQDTDIISSEKDIDFIVAQAEKQVDVLKKVLGIAVKRTSHLDWVDQSGKPYLTASGAEKLMPLFGVSVSGTREKKFQSEDDIGGSYIYKASGTFSWKGGSIEAIGACSSRDKFFAYDGNSGKFKVLSQVDETNILKSAYSNLMVRGITQLLGIRNLTWEQLAEFGLDKNKVTKVTYGKGKKDATDEEKEKQIKLKDMVLQMAYGKNADAAAYLSSITQFTAKDGKLVKGVERPAFLTGMRLNIAFSKAEKDYKIFQRENPQAEKGDK